MLSSLLRMHKFTFDKVPRLCLDLNPFSLLQSLNAWRETHFIGQNICKESLLIYLRSFP